MDSYWSGVLGRRLTRRRALAVSGGGAAAVLLLAACGSSGSKGGANKDTAGLLAKAVDSSAKAVPGSIWKTYAAT